LLISFTFNPDKVTRGHRYKLYVNLSRGIKKHFVAERVVAPWLQILTLVP